MGGGGERLRDRQRALPEHLLNQAIETALVEDGRALVSGTQLNGRRVLRVCIVNHRVTEAGVRQTLVILRELGHQLDAQLRTQNR
jgi:hypothetical protein